MENLRLKAQEQFKKMKTATERKIPMRTKSFEEFVMILERERAQEVTAEVASFTDSSSDGMSGGFVSSIAPVGVGFDASFESRSKIGRKITYREYYGYVPFPDADEEALKAMMFSVISTASYRLDELRALHPDMELSLSTPAGTMSEEERINLSMNVSDEVLLSPQHQISGLFKERNIITCTQEMHDALIGFELVDRG